VILVVTDYGWTERLNVFLSIACYDRLIEEEKVNW